LQLVPGIGPSTAEKILQMRKSYGAFKSVNDLMAIRGLGPKRLEKMRKYLTVGKSAVPAQNTPQSASAKTKPHTPTKSAPSKSAAPPKTPPPQPSTEQAAPETEEPYDVFLSCKALKSLVRSSPLAISGFQSQRHLVRDPYPVAFQRDNLLRMIGQHPYIFQSQVDQNLRPDPTLMLHHTHPRRLAIKLSTRMKMNLR
jgi:competence ComEA-like helix-hairpin-helix protein